jgi:hypothetical protein
MELPQLEAALREHCTSVYNAFNNTNHTTTLKALSSK